MYLNHNMHNHKFYCTIKLSIIGTEMDLLSLNVPHGQFVHLTYVSHCVAEPLETTQSVVCLE